MAEKKRITPFRILSAVMLLPLGASVAVQFNDPDGIVWMVIYGYSILITVPAIFGHNSPWAIPGLIGYLGGFAYLIPSFESPYLKSELTREGGGVLIAGLWMLCIVIAWYRERQAAIALEPPPAPAPAGGGCGSGSCGCGK